MDLFPFSFCVWSQQLDSLWATQLPPQHTLKACMQEQTQLSPAVRLKSTAAYEKDVWNLCLTAASDRVVVKSFKKKKKILFIIQLSLTLLKTEKGLKIRTCVCQRIREHILWNFSRTARIGTNLQQRSSPSVKWKWHSETSVCADALWMGCRGNLSIRKWPGDKNVSSATVLCKKKSWANPHFFLLPREWVQT